MQKIRTKEEESVYDRQSSWRGNSFAAGWTRIYAAVVVVALSFLIVAGVITAVNKAVGQRVYCGTVTAKEFTAPLFGDRYIIRAVDGQNHDFALELSGSVLKGQRDVSQYIGKIHIGTEYRFTACGVCIPLLGRYPNIYDIEPVRDDPEPDAAS